MRKLLTLLLLAQFISVSSSFSAQTSFYTLNDRWQKANTSGKSKKDAVEEGFSSALAQKTLATPGYPTPTPLKRTFAALVREGRTVEMELGQSLFVESDTSIVKFVATDEGIAWLETVNAETLHIKGTGIGRTFIHIWDASSRGTFELRVIPPVFIPSAQQRRQLEALEKSRSFRLGYSNGRSAFYTGDKYKEIQRTTLDFNQLFTLLGDTPYGTVSSHAQTQKDGRKLIFTDMQAVLRDGRIGPVKNFNFAAGDSSVKPDLMVFPQARIRGADLEHWDDKKRVQWHGFYGREETSVIGTLTPGLITKRTRDSFLSGSMMDFKVNEDARIKAGFFTGSGQSRSDELNKRGAGVLGDLRFGPHFTFKPETDFDSERFAQKHALIFNSEKLRVRGETRNINKKFVTLLGAPSRQGELGHLVDVTANPFKNVSFLGSLDVFRDRLIPNPEDLDAYNVHTDLSLSIVPAERSSLILRYQDLDDTGRLAPTKQRTLGAQYNQQVELFKHRMALFSRYHNRRNNFLTNPLSDYVQDQFTLGLQTELFWGIVFSVQQEWNILDEPNVDRLTYPSATLYTLSASHRIGDTPFFVDARLRIRDEEETESQNSFMTGEDSTEVSGGIYYREYEDLEIFLTGRFENFKAESLNVTSPRVEAQFMAGMKYLFDTKFRWDTVGSFSGFVFKDLNADGLRQAGEPGIEGMKVKSSDEKEAVTNQDGFYELKSIAGKKTVISLDSSKMPYGHVPTTASQYDMPIIQDQIQHVDFGIMPRSEITGIIFNDLDGNGKYHLTDKGVGKVKIVLETGVATRSNSLGVYTFPNVVAGEHTASLDLASLPDGYLPLDVPKKSFTVFEGIRYELHFPLRAARAVTGKVYVDKNKNKVLDAGEKTLSNIRVLFGPDSVITDKDGYYLFDNLNSGVYELSVDSGSLPSEFQSVEILTIDLPLEPATLTDRHIPVEMKEIQAEEAE